ncbi:Slit-like protein 3 protein [Trichoplax sp. H2]|nr:Slit-like protein 3 protein [Trichoplax sp. H2]|eukprot:RDD37222.1 Slit-like protein 3 protein [Trichoplax sp. H2]
MIFNVSVNRLLTIENKTFCGLEQLRLLRLDRNKLTHIYPETICAPNLENVYLNSNFFRFIAPTSFRQLNKIKALSIINSRLNLLESYQFSGLESLLKLELTFNNISVINATAFEDLFNLTTLYVKKTDRNIKLYLNFWFFS